MTTKGTATRANTIHGITQAAYPVQARSRQRFDTTSGTAQDHWGVLAHRRVAYHPRAWLHEYVPAGVSAGRSATAFAVSLCMSGAATARIAERSPAVRSRC